MVETFYNEVACYLSCYGSAQGVLIYCGFPLRFANLDVVSLGKVELYKLLNHDAHSLASKIVAQRVRCGVFYYISMLYLETAKNGHSFTLSKFVLRCVV